MAQAALWPSVARVVLQEASFSQGWRKALTLTALSQTDSETDTQTDTNTSPEKSSLLGQIVAFSF